MSHPLSTILSDLRAHLAWQEEWGETLEVSTGSGSRLTLAALRQAAGALPPSAPTRPVPTEAAPPQPPASPSTASSAIALRNISDLPALPPFSPEDRPTLEAVRAQLGDCQRCQLCTGRKQIVFGVGNPQAELVFVGEGPGADEDAQGIPFVGAAGQLLTKMIEAMGFSRSEVYICNVVKCRPPNNRAPELEEMAACEPFLRAQLASLQPKVIVGLGKTAVQALLRSDVAITRIRGQWKEYRGVPLMPTFHPSYLLRQPAEKRNAWADLQEVMKRFGKEPKRS